jgi:hypothetical protein
MLDSSPRIATLRPASRRNAAHRSAPQRITTQRNVSPGAFDSAPRHSAQRSASQRNATFTVSARRCATPRSASLRLATQRNVFIAARRSAAPRRATPRNATFFLEELQMLFETSQETLHLRAFLAGQPPGARLTYAGIEEATGIPMDVLGRGKLRRAAAREQLPYDTMIGRGIVLADAGNGVHIIGGRLERIRRAITRTEKTHADIQSRFLDQMSEEDQKRCIYIGVIFSAMHAAAQRVKGLHMKTAPRKLENA